MSFRASSLVRAVSHSVMDIGCEYSLKRYTHVERHNIVEYRFCSIKFSL